MATLPEGVHEPALTDEGGTSGRGHIGLIVFGSIAAGLVLGLVLDFLVFGGSSEPVITGLALLSLAAGCALLSNTLCALHRPAATLGTHLCALLWHRGRRTPHPASQHPRARPARLGLADPARRPRRLDVPRVPPIPP